MGVGGVAGDRLWKVVGAYLASAVPTLPPILQDSRIQFLNFRPAALRRRRPGEIGRRQPFSRSAIQRILPLPERMLLVPISSTGFRVYPPDLPPLSR